MRSIIVLILFVVSAGNILGGGVLVALVHWTVYIRRRRQDGAQPRFPLLKRGLAGRGG